MAALVSIGKYNMTVLQKETLVDLCLDDEVLLDLMKPSEFFLLKGFGRGYVNYVKELRGKKVHHEVDAYSSPPLDMIVSEEQFPPDEFTPLSSGQVHCRVSMILGPGPANWLQNLLRKLPQNFPNHVNKHNLGWVIQPIILDIMKTDTDRYGPLKEGSVGTYSPAEFAKFASAGPAE